MLIDTINYLKELNSELKSDAKLIKNTANELTNQEIVIGFNAIYNPLIQTVSRAESPE